VYAKVRISRDHANFFHGDLRKLVPLLN
jgi:hypothetical protein